MIHDQHSTLAVRMDDQSPIVRGSLCRQLRSPRWRVLLFESILVARLLGIGQRFVCLRAFTQHGLTVTSVVMHNISFISSHAGQLRWVADCIASDCGRLRLCVYTVLYSNMSSDSQRKETRRLVLTPENSSGRSEAYYVVY